jgi:hypothetical protein
LSKRVPCLFDRGIQPAGGLRRAPRRSHSIGNCCCRVTYLVANEGCWPAGDERIQCPVWRSAHAICAAANTSSLKRLNFAMKFRVCAAALAAMFVACLVTPSAEAARRARPAPVEEPVWSFWSTPAPVARERRVSPLRAAQRNDRSERVNRRASSHDTPSSSRSSGLGPRPAQWCGWYMRSQLGGGPEFNLAANWRRYGSPGSPQVGAVVVWPHHVGVITGRASNGQWIVKQGNYSGRVHEGPRSVAGAVFRV